MFPSTSSPHGQRQDGRLDFDIVVDIPDTEGLDQTVPSLDDLDIVCFIDDEDVFSHTYEEREKKMRVSLLAGDQLLRFRFVNSASQEVAGKQPS